MVSHTKATRAHLVLYNQLQAWGWTTVLLAISLGGVRGAWTLLGRLVIGLQVLCLLDLVPAAAGLWPEDPQIGLLQRLWCKVGHRSELFVSIAVAATQPDAPALLDSWQFGCLLLTWALADVSRFHLYTLRTLGRQPPPWLA